MIYLFIKEFILFIFVFFVKPKGLSLTNIIIRDGVLLTPSEKSQTASCYTHNPYTARTFDLDIKSNEAFVTLLYILVPESNSSTWYTIGRNSIKCGNLLLPEHFIYTDCFCLFFFLWLRSSISLLCLYLVSSRIA